MINQHFLARPLVPNGGSLGLPEGPGIGMDLDPAKIEEEVEVFA